MKRTILLFAVIILSAVQVAMSQDVNVVLRFTGAKTDSSYVQLDSVRVQNLTRSWTETIVYPDTVLSFTKVGIINVQNVAAEVVSYPNPFNGTTNLSVSVPQSGDALVQVYNLAGQKVAERAMTLEAGRSLFEVRLQHPQVYLLAVTTPQGRSTIKLLNRGTNAGNSITFFGNSNFVEKIYCSKPFQIGDQLKMFGYVTHNGYLVTSNVVQQSQSVSENFTLYFAISPADVPKVITTAVSNITTTSAYSGGVVTSQGSSPVTARGVCWDTLQNPTITGSHTSNGTGVGSFTSNITGLTPGATYYVRAYATNTAGTGYGDQVSFKTDELDTNAYFAVSATYSVIFSPGNLQWSATGGGSTPTTHVTADSTAAGTWRFAPNQWDTIGANNSIISSSCTGWIDLFGWATSGWDNGNYFYQPYSNSSSMLSPYTNAIGNGYGPTDGTSYSYSLTGAYANADWGVFNAIYNPATSSTDAPGTWRTPTRDEWDYLLCRRITTSGIRFAKATVNGVTGLIVLPENWSASTYALNNTNVGNAAFSSNVISAANWATLERAGAIFLPAAGARLGAWASTDDRGYYWSVTCPDSISAAAMVIVPTNVYGYNYGNRVTGRSVRLVRDTNNVQSVQLPTVATDTASNITSTSATCGGNVTSNGGAAVTARGVCWSLSQNPTVSGSHTNDGTGIGGFTSSLTGLTSGATYYVRAFATNSVGTAYGNQVVFTTP